MSFYVSLENHSPMHPVMLCRVLYIYDSLVLEKHKHLCFQYHPNVLVSHTVIITRVISFLIHCFDIATSLDVSPH